MIKTIWIQNFRAIRETRVEDVSTFFALTGRNGSGKSNVLQALNLFFNGEIEDGVPLELGIDFHRVEQRKDKRQVRVEVEFSLPSVFTFQKGIRDKAKELGLTARPLVVARQWELDPAAGGTISWYEIKKKDGTWGKVDSDLDSILATFLTRLVHYRYVPNHVHPFDLVEHESASVRREVLTRLKRTSSAAVEKAFETMSPVARKLMEASVELVRTAAPELLNVELATPESMSDVVFPLTLAMATQDGIDREIRVHGSGHQSLLAYSLLHLVDSSFASKFGWHQATIWGIEEPESFLHEELAYGLGAMLRGIASEERFQVLATTHSPTIMAFCSGGTVIDGGRSETVQTQDLIPAATSAGAAPFVHPLIRGAVKPILLVEGNTDVTHLRSAYQALRRPNPWDIRSLEEFGVAGGASGMQQLIKYHAEPLGARPRDAPVVGLLDHDVGANKVERRREEIQQLHPSSTVVQWSRTKANPELDCSVFSGIEAFLTTDALELVESAGFLTLLRPGTGHPIHVDRSTIDKSGLANQLAQEPQEGHYRLFAPILDFVESYLTSSPQLVAQEKYCHD